MATPTKPKRVRDRKAEIARARERNAKKLAEDIQRNAGQCEPQCATDTCGPYQPFLEPTKSLTVRMSENFDKAQSRLESIDSEMDLLQVRLAQLEGERNAVMLRLDHMKSRLLGHINP